MADTKESTRKLRLTETRRQVIFDKTGGHCHFCGDALVFALRGKWHGPGTGAWEADHVVQLARGGVDVVDNYLPACSECNRARWDNSGKRLRHLLALGIVAYREIDRETNTGKALKLAFDRAETATASRRARRE